METHEWFGCTRMTARCIPPALPCVCSPVHHVPDLTLSPCCTLPLQPAAEAGGASAQWPHRCRGRGGQRRGVRRAGVRLRRGDGAQDQRQAYMVGAAELGLLLQAHCVLTATGNASEAVRCLQPGHPQAVHLGPYNTHSQATTGQGKRLIASWDISQAAAAVPPFLQWVCVLAAKSRS